MKSNSINLSPVAILFALLMSAAQSWGATPRELFNIRDFGAVGDGKTLETKAINSAIDAAAKSGGGTVYLPPGSYLTGTIQIKSHVTVELDAGATILGSENPDDYPPMENPWPGDNERAKWISPLIYAVD